MTDMQDRRDVRRGHDDRERRAIAAISIGSFRISLECLGVEPAFVDLFL
jgi:hypothetical protein